MKSKLSKGIALVLIANLINLAFNLLTNLIVPKHLSVNSYAAIKTYQLYMTYVGIMHFGYNDGIYLSYGGKNFQDINRKNLANQVSNIRIFLLILMIISVGVSYIFRQWILLIVCIAMLPTNMLSFFQFLYQACGEFKLYGRIINYVSIGTFVINSALIFGISTDNYLIYLLSYGLLNCIIWLITEMYFKKIIGEYSIIHFSVSELVDNMKNGILLTLGNFSSILMTTMDRWMVSVFVGTIGFAQYSFAVSMENFLNTAITPITITLYNYFCQNDYDEENKRIKQLVIIFGSIAISAAFPVKFILEIYLQKYYDALYVLFLLFSSQLFYIIIKGVYVNLYKARKQQRKYFADLITVLIFGLSGNLLLYQLIKTKESFAVATLLSAVFWLIKCQFHFRDITIKEFAYIFLELLLFLFLGFNVNALLGLIIYAVFTIILIALLLPGSLRDIHYMYNKLISKFQMKHN